MTHALAPTIPLALFALFQMKFAIITPSLITGSFAERVRFSSYMVFMILFSLFVYAPLAHWTWHPDGFLKQMGVMDFAGGIVVHASSGVAALAGAIFLADAMSRMVNPPTFRSCCSAPHCCGSVGLVLTLVHRLLPTLSL